ncbi:MAG: hypothetical protein LBR07_01395, partial [Puniceicoccales bacterium]|nr:hypothetical protein [Puniceicoccales bacterium]
FKRAPQLTFLRATLLAAAGMLPFVLWEIFATIYYGFPFPNTAYAKLSTNYPFSDYLKRGIWYFCDSLIQDAIVLAVPATLAFVCNRLRKLSPPPPQVLCILAGILLYYIYLLRIGGDFMSGRHFSVPFFIAIFALFSTRFTAAALPKIRPRLAKVLGGLLCYQTLMGAVPLPAWPGMLPLTTGEWWFTMSRKWMERPVCERTPWFWATSFVLSARTEFISKQPPRMVSLYPEPYSIRKIKPKELENIKGDFLLKALGYDLWFFGQGKCFTDRYALGDAFLARIRPDYQPQWKIGHVLRSCPTGYRASLRTGANHVEDPNLHRYLDALWGVIRSDKLLTRRRLELIWKFNTGQFDPLLRAWEDGPRKSEPPLELCAPQI